MVQNGQEELNCPCPNVPCERHGKCYECVRFHRDKPEIVCCMRAEYRNMENQ